MSGASVSGRSTALTALWTACGLVVLWMGGIAVFGFDRGPMVAFCSILVLIGLTGVWLGRGGFPLMAGNLLTLLCMASGERFDPMHIAGLTLFLLGLLTWFFGKRWAGGPKMTPAPAAVPSTTSDSQTVGGGEQHDQQRA